MSGKNNKNWTVPVVEDLRPEYYDRFHCLAAGCRFSCCKGWSITFDKKDYLSLRRQGGSPELTDKLEHGVRRIRKRERIHYGEFDMDSGTCPLLGEDSLCILQKERGHEVLPEVCQTFPRTEAYLTGYLERSLSTACEGVLQLLWDLPHRMEFVSDPLPKRAAKEMSVEEDGTLLPFFTPVREVCIDLLQDSRLSLPQRIFLLGAALKELADGEEDIARWAVRARMLPGMPGAAELLSAADAEKALPLFLSNNIHVLSGASVSGPLMLSVKAEVLSAHRLEVSEDLDSTTIPLGPYLDARARFEANFSDHPYFMENLMVALFFHLHMPNALARAELWKSYVNFCNLYSFFRYMAVMSCREGAAGDRAELFRMLVFASRSLIHNGTHQQALQDHLFRSDSATLAHMAILLGG